MKNYALSLLLILFSPFIYGQEGTETEKDEKIWETKGKFALLFNQTAFNAEWTGGGTSNYAGSITVNYDINYRKDNLSWDTRMVGEYGITKNKSDKYLRKTNDRLDITSTVGWQIEESNWFYSFFTNFRTQFTKGYRFSEDQDGNVIRQETTHFLSPGYLQFGPGILWKKSDNLKVNIAPATSRLIFVDRQFTTTPGYQDGDYFGVDENESLRYEFGASLNAYAKFDLMKNVEMENDLNLYSNYLEDPQNIDIDYTMNLNMPVNKYLTANFIFQAIYDDNTVKGFQIREVFGLGLNFEF